MKRILGSRIVIAVAALLAGFVLTQAFNSFVPDPHDLDREVPARMSAGSAEFARTLGGLFGPDIVPGNQVTTLVNGDEIFPAMLAAIEGAERTINFETYVYWDGAIATTFADALAEKARDGVEVRVLMDWQGSVPTDPALIETMEAAGVAVERFRPIHWYTLDKINNRTHRKLLITDGQTGFTGGVGIADEWLGDARNPEEWRENHYRIEGPVLAQFQGAFADNWAEASGELLQGDGFFPPLDPVGEMDAQLLNSSVGSQNVTHLMMMTALASARERILIGTPYFVPDEIAKAQLIDARRRGVEVLVLVPGEHTNKDIVRSASRHFWGALLEAGVRFFEFDPTMYHVKMVMVDEGWASVGSANFDERSFRLNDEANLNLYYPDFVREQIAIFEADLARSTEVTLDDWENRPIGQKIGDWLWSHLRVQL